MEVLVDLDDPRRGPVADVLVAHLREMHATTPVAGVFAFDVEALAAPGMRFYSARTEDGVMAVGALHELDATHVEIKSMHTVRSARRHGVARTMLDHLVDEAVRHGYERISLETGNMDAFAAARALYQRAGFEECEPFGPYVGSTTSTCMTKAL